MAKANDKKKAILDALKKEGINSIDDVVNKVLAGSRTKTPTRLDVPNHGLITISGIT